MSQNIDYQNLFFIMQIIFCDFFSHPIINLVLTVGATLMLGMYIWIYLTKLFLSMA